MISIPQHAVAVIGGSVAGAEAAKILSQHGVAVFVFDAHARPYGKIEDGMPLWHDKQRIAEYRRIDEAYASPLVHFIPNTRVGVDVSFEELSREWGFDAVLLANGAWRDRPLGLEGVDDYIGRGLYYQNPFIQWVNHHQERNYRGPMLEVMDGAIVVGGGLASIDVCKALMVITIQRALRRRGIEVGIMDLEKHGCDKVLEERGLTLEQLEVTPCTLFYRRRAVDMPLVAEKEGGDDKAREQAEKTRMALLNRAMRRYLFRVQDTARPIEKIVEEGRLAGLRFIRTEVREGNLVDISGSEFDVRAPLTISSIGSIPEAIPGVQMQGELYNWRDWKSAQLATDANAVFGLGNVVTGKGNIAISRKHSKQIMEQVTQQHFGFAPLPLAEDNAQEVTLESDAANVVATVAHKPPMLPQRWDALLQRVRARQQRVGYAGDYAAWISAHPPIEMQGVEIR